MALKERVRRNFEYILDHLNVSVTDYLYQEQVLEVDEYGAILRLKADTKEACRQLLMTMMRKSDDKFETFFTCLDSRGGIVKKALKEVPEDNTGSPRNHGRASSSIEDMETHGESRTHEATSQENLATPSPFTYNDPIRLIPVACPAFRMHPGLANKQYCAVTLRGHLENRPAPLWSWGGLMQYRGTIATHSLYPIGDVQYWETRSHVRMTRRLVWDSGDSILEMGIAEDGSVDSNYNVSVDPRYWCVTVSCCSLHKPMICTSVWQQGRLVVCHTVNRHHTQGAQRLFTFGIAVDVWTGRIVFIDVARQVVLAVLDTRFRQPLFPMFGVSVHQDYYAVTMELISGGDIDMTDRKRWLISNAMSL